MSKGLRFCLVLGVACVILGGGIAGAAVAMGADRAIGLPLWSLDYDWDRSWDRSWDNGWPEAGEYSAGEFRDSGEGESYAGINKLDIDFAAGNIVVQSSEEKEIRIWTDNQEHYRWFVEEDTLKIDGPRKKAGYSDTKNTLYIQIPQDWLFEEVNIDMAAGNFYADELYAGDLSIEIAAGNVEIDGGRIGELSVDMAAGRVSCRAEVRQDLDIDMTAGDVTVWMQGGQDEYNYDINCVLGNITVGNTSYSGIGNKKEIDNHSDRKADIDCSAGNVTLKFEN